MTARTPRRSSRTPLLPVLVTGLLLTLVPALPASAVGTATAATTATAGSTQARTTRRVIHLGGVKVRIRKATDQVVTVNRRSGYHATVTLWRRTDDGWKRVMSARDGRIGYGGLAAPRKRVQGTGTTPIGTYRLPFAFGTHAKRKAWHLTYRRIKGGDYWVQDNRSDYYNRYRNKSQGGFRWWLDSSSPNASERLADYPVQYEYAVVIGYNPFQVRHRGAGIFLHVNGDGATAGCVSAPRWFLRKALARLRPGKTPLIAIGA
ncbi:L,D-transpeptidase family protein [Nocardioides sp. GY 10127]|uniref:L,D-transpeptidase family protein n=1 Tax=Nocardioides sp. GY 10127 TaxID=2569762 RepID=UPI0010A929D5|nr:L,D-transpeptidase family protein [Nocardioides sp. GY 10127]TIC81636.1 hypothetical protein E8D37_10545 [Nocardioides sp. GY 10127]